MSIKLNPIMLVLGSLAAVVGGWGLFTMMTRIGGAPPFIGIITIACWSCSPLAWPSMR